MNKAQGGAWNSERRTPTAVDKIRDAAREAGEKARRVFGKWSISTIERAAFELRALLYPRAHGDLRRYAASHARRAHRRT
jgi:hypothetical protein